MTGVHHREQPYDPMPAERQHHGQRPQQQWAPHYGQPPVPQQRRPEPGQPFPPYGPPMGAYQPHQPAAAPAPRNGLGIASLCVALVGAVFMLMPITGFLAVVLGGLGLIFGLIGWARARRGQATNGRMAISATALSSVVTVVGIIGVVMFFQATAQFVDDMNKISGAGTTPYAGPSAAPAAPASTSYTYEVTGNYRATQLHFTDSNGDSTTLNDTGNITTAGSALPWSKTVSPEPNGNYQSLNASTLSEKGDSWITCTIKDDKGAVVATDTGKGAYASCYASTPFN